MLPICLSTPLKLRLKYKKAQFKNQAFIIYFVSGRRDLNPRSSVWQTDALPLSYSRFISLLTVKILSVGPS